MVDEMKATLLPCPFCGVAVEYASVPTASAPIVHHPPDRLYCAMAGRFVVASAWNTRPDSQPREADEEVAEESARLREALEPFVVTKSGEEFTTITVRSSTIDAARSALQQGEARGGE